VVGEPVEHVEDGALVLGDGRVETETIDRIRRRGERPDQVGEADLDPGPLEHGQHQAQVGQPAPVERPAAPGHEHRPLRRVHRVEPAHQPDLVRGSDQRVAEQLGEVTRDQVGPAQYGGERPGPRSLRGDEIVCQHQAHGMLI